MTPQQPQPGTQSCEVIGLDSRQLLQRHIDGDPEAFRELMNLYRAKVYSYLSRSSIGVAERDDLFQEIFLKVHRFSRSYDASRPLTPWIFSIVVNTLRSHLRKLKIQDAISPDGKDHERPSSERIDESVTANETATFLSTSISRLPEKQREALLLYVTSGMEQQEIATTLDVPVNTVKTLIRRARGSLATSLAARKVRIEREVSR